MPRWKASVALVLTVMAAASAARADEGERKIGQRVYEELARSGKILTGTPYNRALEPVAEKLAQAARGLYDEPFRFWVVHDPSINAFAAPGGYAFVNDGLIEAVGTKDELAGVMCHEMNHVIHHDGVNLERRANAMNIGLTAASILLRTPVGRAATNAAGYAADFSLLHFSRGVETAADLGGADLCAKAGYNPYGLVWTMELLAAHAGHGTLEMLSNHPRDDHRISDLLAHFKSAPATFDRFKDDRAHAVPVFARRDDPVPLRYVNQYCPRGDAGRLAAQETAGWYDRETPWLSAIDAPGAATSPAVGVDTIALAPGAAVRWFRPKDELGGTSIAFDAERHAGFVCSATPVATRIAVVGAMHAPPFPAGRADLSVAHTAAGIALLAPVADVLRLYGPAAPARSDDGSWLYRYGGASATSETATEWFRVKDGVVIAFGRDVVYEPSRPQGSR